ncbi:MAG: hypothetical protein E7372_02390 [Clostridiales bacterium]|nr:hypothetical protein [Clostridiales bacterium]
MLDLSQEENMTVYIEYVIIDNVIIDYLLLKATFVFTGFSSRKCRLFLCAFLGAIISLVFPLVEINGLILTSLKIMSGLLILLLANNYKSFNAFFRCTIVFFLLTFLSGGAVTGLYNLLGISLGTESVVASVILPVYLVLKLLSKTIIYLCKRVNIVKFCYDVELTYYDKSIKAKGFLDTGNNLYYKENAVILCSKGFAKEFLGDSILTTKFNKLKVSTVAGEKTNLCFKIDKFILYNQKQEHIFNYVTVCIADFDSTEYQIILHPALLKEKNGIESNKFFQKVS